MITNIIAYGLIVFFFFIERVFRTGNDSKTLERSEYDKRSTLLVGIALILSTALLVLTPVFTDELGKINFDYIGFYGIIMMAIGIAIRFIAARTLGMFYMRTVRRAENHKLIKSGLYHHIRHPGYLGIFLIFIGAAIAVENYVTLVLVFLFILLAYVYRIKVEEEMLVQVLGREYREYMKQTKRIIPLVY